MALPSEKRSVWRKLVLVVLVSLVLLEGAVRLRQWLRYGTTDGYYQLVLHPESGLQIPTPGLEVGPIRVDSRGFRGPELEVPKPPGRFRLAFLGGSTTFCAEASSLESTWPYLVVEGLRERFDGVDLDFVNASCAGYSTEESLLNLRYRVAELEPDLILVYHGTNDLTQDSRVLAAAEGRYDPERREGSWLAEHWLTYALVEKNLRYRARQKRAAEDRDPFRPDLETLAAPFEERLHELLEACKEVAPWVALATFSQRARPDQDPEELLAACSSSLYYMPFMNPEVLLEGFAHYNDVLRRVGREEGVLVIEGEEEIPGTREYFHDSVHFTDAGSRAMADRVLEALLADEDLVARLAAD